MSQSGKYRNTIHNEKVAFVVDDITSRSPPSMAFDKQVVVGELGNGKTPMFDDSYPQ